MASFWDRITGRARKSNSLEVLRELFGGRVSKSGQRVNVKNAIEVAAVFACIRVLSDGVAQVPLKLFQESDDGKTRLPAKKHPLYRILFRRPNAWQTSFQFRETLMLHVGLCGNHYSFKNRVQGRIVELIPFEPGQVAPKRDKDTYELRYEVRADNGQVQSFPQSAIWHVRGPSWNSWMGLEAVTIAREAIGLAMAIEEQQSKFYELGATASGILSIDGKLQDDQYKKLTKWIDENHAGSRNAGRPMIVDHAAKWLQQTMSAADAQMIEQRRYQVEEVCRAFRVMPIMLGHADKTATYASAEQMFLAHVVHTLSPWYERLEQDIDVNLLTEQDQDDGIYAKFVEEGLLRGAMKDTADYLQRLTAAGIMTRNEARAKLDMNPIDGLDEPLTPVNMVAGDPPRVTDSEPAPQAAAA